MRSEEGDEPMTVEEMKKKKSELGFSCEQISARSGVPLGTVQKIFSGITKRPRYDTICQLEKAFPMEPDSKSNILGMMKESVSAYRIYGDGTDHEGDIWKSFRGKKQGEYTLKDYEAIPDEYRVELIDGVIYDLNTPTTIHQQLAFEISIRLREYIRQTKDYVWYCRHRSAYSWMKMTGRCCSRTSLYAVTEIKSFEVMSMELRIW